MGKLLRALFRQATHIAASAKTADRTNKEAAMNMADYHRDGGTILWRICRGSFGTRRQNIFGIIVTISRPCAFRIRLKTLCFQHLVAFLWLSSR